MEGLRFISEFCSAMHEMNLRFSHSCPPPNDGELGNAGPSPLLYDDYRGSGILVNTSPYRLAELQRLQCRHEADKRIYRCNGAPNAKRRHGDRTSRARYGAGGAYRSFGPLLG